MTIHSVLLVEDEIGTRLAMCDKILAHPDLSLYSAVGSCEEALHCMSRGVDVLLTDLGLPDGSGISLVKHAKTLPCPPEVMVVTTFGDEANVVAAITAGASSYLLPKSCKWHFQHLLPESTLLKCRRIIGRIGSYSSVFAV